MKRVPTLRILRERCEKRAEPLEEVSTRQTLERHLPRSHLPQLQRVRRRSVDFSARACGVRGQQRCAERRLLPRGRRGRCCERVLIAARSLNCTAGESRVRLFVEQRHRVRGPLAARGAFKQHAPIVGTRSELDNYVSARTRGRTIKMVHENVRRLRHFDILGSSLSRSSYAIEFYN